MTPPLDSPARLDPQPDVSRHWKRPDIGNRCHIAARDGALTSFGEATARLPELARPLGAESVLLDATDGRVLAAPVIARRAAPATAVSAMDGYAVRDADFAQESTWLEIAGKSFAGRGFDGPLPAGKCVRIFTGAPVPAGADRVVIQECARPEGNGVRFEAPPAGRRHIRLPGSDFALGDVMVPAGRTLDPGSLIAAAASDLAEVTVYRRPSVSILCCGDELAEPGCANDRPERIPESVSFGLSALVRRWGGTVASRHLVGDRLGALEQAAARALDTGDIVVVVGGASVGEKDYAKSAFIPHGLDLLFAKVAIKPGKPVWLGTANGVPILGLPGNPTAAMVTARLFLAPLVHGMAGADIRDALHWQTAPVTRPVPTCADKDSFLRASVTAEGATPHPDQDSANQKTLAGIDHLVRGRAGASDIPAGSLVEILKLWPG